MIRLRDDDVLVPSSSWGSPFDRFKELHEWVAASNGTVVHVPTVLVKDVQRFSECIDYMERHTDLGTMEPQIHGLEHIDYSRLGLPANKVPARGKLDLSQFTPGEQTAHQIAVLKHLDACMFWFQDNLGRLPTKWYTPWGADNALLRQVAEYKQLELVGTDKLFPIKEALNMLKSGSSIADVEKRGEVFIHWWERGRRVQRLCVAAKHGSYLEALKQEPDAFTD